MVVVIIVIRGGWGVEAVVVLVVIVVLCQLCTTLMLWPSRDCEGAGLGRDCGLLVPGRRSMHA